jgi:hypothetical protein
MNKVNTADDGAPASAETMSSERLNQLREEVSKLKVTGGMANPERLAGKWGIGLTIFGFVVAIVSWWSAFNSADLGTNVRSQIFALIGIGISIVGMILWIRNSLTRYFRFWLIRLVYEQREQTDRLIAALERERS